MGSVGRINLAAVPALVTSRARRLNTSAFPAETPLKAFFAWNEARRDTDRRYRILCHLQRLLDGFGHEFGLAYLVGEPFTLRRAGRRRGAAPAAVPVGRSPAGTAHAPAIAAAERVIDTLQAAIGAFDIARHAAVFQAFEELARHIDLDALARLRPRQAARPVARRRHILIIKLGALGDFVQALAPVPAIRRHHADDRLSLLTTGRYADFARQTGLFDEILIDRRPGWTDLSGWLALRRLLRSGSFDRVYDFQTSDRSDFYFRMLWPGPWPEWSGTARHCSHPHANLGRDLQHTLDRQAEQLLMAGIYPIPLVPTLPVAGRLPPALAGRRFALLIPGASPHRPAKRWPADHYGALARRLLEAGYLPVVAGVAGEEAAGRTVCNACPEAVDLVGCTDVGGLAALAGAATLTIGNDTGATHVAAAGAHPVIVLFSRASSPSLCAPRGAAVRVLSMPDLADLPIETVFAAALAAVAAAESATSPR
jgi:ADP-heptose:LPS heptosyltransferase